MPAPADGDVFNGVACFDWQRAKRQARLVVTRQQLADLIGINADTIWRMVNEGMPFIKKGGSGRGDQSQFDAVECLTWWRDRLPGPKEKETVQLEKMRLDIQLTQMKLDEQHGRLVSVDEVIRDGQTVAKGWMTELLALPRVAIQHGVLAPDQEPALAALCRDIAERIATWRSIPAVQRRIEELNAAHSESAA